MSPRIRAIRNLQEALALAPLLDACAAEYNQQFTDAPYPKGASKRFLERHFQDHETLLLVADAQVEGAPAAGAKPAGICLIGALEDILLQTRTPMILVLYVQDPVRHQGLATRLVHEARSLLAERGLFQLAGRVGHNDDALISMGERWGFVRNWELMIKE
jgi:ribosomal protein S18 acetylase RimI-like enzyme